jgi:DNA invertase Pin-like site-specific DNA recombinase
MTTNDVKYRAAAYLRVSSKEQDESTQLPDIRRAAKEDNAVIDDRYIFRDKISGFKSETERPGLNELLQLTKDEIDIIYIWEISRLARDMKIFNKLLGKIKEKEINVCFIKPLKLHVFDLGTTTENFYTQMVIMFISQYAFFEIELKNERTKRGRVASIAEGNTYTSCAPFGYKKEEKKLVPDYSAISDVEGFKTPVQVVQTIFQMYNGGVKMDDIAAQLNDLNIPTNFNKFLKPNTTQIEYKSGIIVERDNLKWIKTTVYNILCNNVYTGEKTINQTIKINEKEWKKVQKTISIPPIISKETFQLTAQTRTNNKFLAEKSVEKDYLLRGVLYCECGRAYTCSASAKRRVYICGDTKTKGHRTYKECKNSSINQTRANYMIWETVKEIYQEYALNETRQKTVSDYTFDFEKIDYEIQQCNIKVKQYDRLNENTVNKMVRTENATVFMRLEKEINAIEVKKDEIIDKINKLNLRKAELKTYAKKIEELNNMQSTDFDISEIETDGPRKKEAIKKIIDKIIISNITDERGKKIVILKILPIKGKLSDYNSMRRIIYYQAHQGIWAKRYYAVDAEYEYKLYTQQTLDKIEYVKLPVMK